MNDFATKEKPLRASALWKLLQCPGRMMFEEDNAGAAADTGSLVHLGIKSFHSTKDVNRALQDMKNCSLYPKSDEEEAKRHLTPYTKDPRNVDADIVLAERPVDIVLDGDIYIRGHLDQVRRESDGKLYVWDVKTGKRHSGYEMLHIATAQLCAYTIGACQVLGQPVYPGGIISTYGYRKRGAGKPETSPTGVFFHAPWELSDCAVILKPLVSRVREIRRDELYVIPGKHCSDCMGLGSCLPKLREYNVRR